MAKTTTPAPKRTRTRATAFRFEDEFFAKLDALVARWTKETGVPGSRADMLRVLVHQEYTEKILDKEK